MTMDTTYDHRRIVSIGRTALEGIVDRPDGAGGLIIFAHGSGSGRLSPRNNYVARALQGAGFATLLLDLLTPAEDEDRASRFNIHLLAERLLMATQWAGQQPDLALPIGYFGASTGAGAALMAAAAVPGEIGAIVSRGGRPDLAGAQALARVTAPTQLIVGSRDLPVIEMNRAAMRHLRAEHELVIVPGATHLFEEAGTLDMVIGHARRWFERHLLL